MKSEVRLDSIPRWIMLLTDSLPVSLTGLYSLLDAKQTIVKGGRTNNRADPKVCKSCCHKTNPGNYFDDPTLPTGSLRCACVYIAARRQDYCSLVPRPSPQLSSLAVRITLRRPGKNYHVMYATDVIP